MADLVSPRTRRAFQEALSGWTLREIEGFFEDACIKRCNVPEHLLPSGQRRSLVACYYASINWQDPNDIARVFEAYQALLAEIKPDNDLGRRLLENLRADGWHYNDGHIVPVSMVVNAVSSSSTSMNDNKPCPIHSMCAEYREIERDYKDAKVFVAIPYSGYIYEDAGQTHLS